MYKVWYISFEPRTRALWLYFALKYNKREVKSSNKRLKVVGITLARVKEQDGMLLAKVKEQDGLKLAKVKEQDGMMLAKVKEQDGMMLAK